MDAERPGSLKPLTNDGLDRELRDLLAIEPSPEFAARVRTHIQQQTSQAPWLTWPRIAVGVASLAGLVAATVMTLRTTPTTPVLVQTPTSPVASAPAPVPAMPNLAEPSVPREAVARRSNGPQKPRRVHPREDDVIMPRDEVRGMQELLAMAAQRDPRLAAMFDVPDISLVSPLPEFAPIVIEPLQIEPLVPETY